jgi:ABC-type glycerol-3-phosphate transport system substrate-binding protein
MKYKGRLYGVPINSSPGLAFYRADILDQFKIKPGDLKTWDSLILAGKKVTDEKAGRFMTFLSSPAEAYATDPWSVFLSSMKGNIFDEQGNVIRNNKTAERAFKFWYDLAYTHKIAKLEPFGRPGFWSFVKSNNVCVFPWAAAILGVLKTQVPEQSGKWRAMAWPTWPGQTNPEVGDLGSCIVTIPKQGKNYDLAATWVDYLCTNLEAQKAVYQTGLVPAYKPALDADFMKSPDPYIGGQIFADVINSQGSVTFNWFYWTQASSIIGSELDAMLAKKKTAEQAWKDAENLLATKLKN